VHSDDTAARMVWPASPRIDADLRASVNTNDIAWILTNALLAPRTQNVQINLAINRACVFRMFCKARFAVGKRHAALSAGTQRSAKRQYRCFPISISVA
jgi:hypothetical protein